jgi:hypothetical protein
VWVLTDEVPPPGLESRRFGSLTIVRAETGSAGRYLDVAESLLSGIDLETVREARRRYERESRSTASR